MSRKVESMNTIRDWAAQTKRIILRKPGGFFCLTQMSGGTGATTGYFQRPKFRRIASAMIRIDRESGYYEF